ncbi:MAG: hypothetical protein R2854_04765 [Caldilineaceae bacterium]
MTGALDRAAIAQSAHPVRAHAPAATTITVTRSDDTTSDSITRTCGYTAGIYQTQATTVRCAGRWWKRAPGRE